MKSNFIILEANNKNFTNLQTQMEKLYQGPKGKLLRQTLGWVTISLKELMHHILMTASLSPFPYHPWILECTRCSCSDVINEHES